MTHLYIVDQSGLEPGGHYYSYTRSVADGARRLGLEPVILANKKFRIPPDASRKEILPCFTYTWAEAEQHGSLAWENGNIANELFRVLRRVRAAPDDRVFLHTIGYRELLALLDWFTHRILPGDPIPPGSVPVRP